MAHGLANLGPFSNRGVTTGRPRIIGTIDHGWAGAFYRHKPWTSQDKREVHQGWADNRKGQNMAGLKDVNCEPWVVESSI